MIKTYMIIILMIFGINVAFAEIKEVNYNGKFDKSNIKVLENSNNKLNTNLKNNVFINFNINKKYFGSRVENDELDKKYGSDYKLKSDKYFSNKRHNGFDRDEHNYGKDLKYEIKSNEGNYEKELREFNKKNNYKKSYYNKYNLRFRDSNFNNKNIY